MGLGCMALTGIYGAIEADVAKATIHRALDLGIRLFDTAALYGDGANEELLGRTLGGRGDVFVVTKFGLEVQGDSLVRDSAPAAMRRSVDTSLRRLRRDRIDLLLQHRPDPLVPDEEVAAMARDLVQAGKVAEFGLSGTPVDRIGRFTGTVRVAAVQNELSIAAPDRAGDAAAADRFGAMLMGHSPLGRGLLTGRAGRPPAADDLRSGMPQFRDAPSDLDANCLNALEEIAASRALPMEAIALAWTLHLGGNVVPIPGSRSPQQVERIASSAEVALTPEEVGRLAGDGD
ncbi:aldo/keto reductase [Sphingomonas sp.]|uniref:aldo/keto reductase n=1 Tax=Sphingomonas sp. TaxID=28214 RepID=UPI0035BBF416